MAARIAWVVVVAAALAVSDLALVDYGWRLRLQHDRAMMNYYASQLEAAEAAWMECILKQPIVFPPDTLERSL